MAGGSLTVVSTGKPNLVLGKNAKPKPFKKVYRAKYHKYKPKQKMTMSRDLTVNRFPLIKESRMMNLKYKASFTQICPVANFNWANIFRMFSIYDPDYGNVTKNLSVQGINQVSALYKKYHVMGFSAKVTLINTMSQPVLAYIGGANINTWLSDYSTSKLPSSIATRPGIKSAILLGAGSGKEKAVLHYKCKPRDVIGLTANEWGGSAWSANLNANPAGVDSNFPYLTIGSGLLDETGTNATSLKIFVELNYYTKIYDVIENDDA